MLSRVAAMGATRILSDATRSLIVPRRAFTADPLALDRDAVAGRWLLESLASADYPTSVIWQSLVGVVQPRILYTNAAMLEVLPSRDAQFDPVTPPAIVAVVHVFYTSMIDELLDRLVHLPCTYDVVITTTDEAKATFIRDVMNSRSDPGIGRSEVRVVASNRGRAESAFFIECRDVLQDERYDLVIKLHSKRSPQDGAAGAYFRRELLDNLLLDREYASSVLALFQREPGLGAVFPPMIHTGYPTMGHGWMGNRDALREVSLRLGIEVPLDDASPLAPYGNMFVARRSALQPLLSVEWTYEQFPNDGEYADGSLSHVLERMPAYAAAQAGFHTRSVATGSYVAMSHSLLEYKLDRMSSGVGGYAIDQVAETHRLMAEARGMDDGSRSAAIKLAVRRVAPGLAHLVARIRGR